MHLLSLRSQRDLYLSELSIVFLIQWHIREGVIIRLLLHGHRHRLLNAVRVVKGLSAGMAGNLVHDPVLGYLLHEGGIPAGQVGANVACRAQVAEFVESLGIGTGNKRRLRGCRGLSGIGAVAEGWRLNGISAQAPHIHRVQRDVRLGQKIDSLLDLVRVVTGVQAGIPQIDAGKDSQREGTGKPDQAFSPRYRRQVARQLCEGIHRDPHSSFQIAGGTKRAAFETKRTRRFQVMALAGTNLYAEIEGAGTLAPWVICPSTMRQIPSGFESFNSSGSDSSGNPW
jgi:hypothetical protein